MPSPSRIASRLVWACLLGAAVAAGWALHTGRITVPPAWNPWAPLDIAEPPGLFTRHKLDRLAAAPAACRAWLDGAGVRQAPVADRMSDDGCGWQNASRVSGVGRVAFSSSFTLACPAAAALALWERHALQPAAVQHLGSAVATIDHLGSYACRNVYGQAEGQRSQHAVANALDVAGFRLADGRRVSVLRDWGPVESRGAGPAGTAGAADTAAARTSGAPAAETANANGAGPALAPAAQFLRAAHRGACGFFAGVLGPGYNAAHRDHLHLDRGPYRVCR